MKDWMPATVRTLREEVKPAAGPVQEQRTFHRKIFLRHWEEKEEGNERKEEV